MYQFVRVNMVVLLLFFVSSLSFGMDQALFEFEKVSPELQCNIINRLDDPVRLGKTSKFMHALVKTEGEHNLRKLYKNQDLDFAQSFLLSHYVPVILINNPNPFEKDAVNCFSVNAYAKSFYGQSSDGLLSKEVIQQHSKRFNEAIQQKRIQYNGSTVTSCLKYNDALIKAVLFGKFEDLWKELKAKDCKQEIIMRSVQAILSCKPGNVNLLETLLLMLKKKQLKILENYVGESTIIRGLHSYNLLFLADRSNNKKAFEMLSDIDPYLMNREVWRKSTRNDECVKTSLDRMIEDGNFNLENIEIFKKYGALTTKQVIAEGRMPKIESYHRRGNFSAGTITIDYNGDGSYRC